VGATNCDHAKERFDPQSAALNYRCGSTQVKGDATRDRPPVDKERTEPFFAEHLQNSRE
jgi:hypothetical protein